MSNDLTMESPMSPVFVLGCGRSGTTLVRLILSANARIGIPPEGHFLTDLYGRFYRGSAEIGEKVERFCDAVMRSDRFDEWKVERSRLLRRLEGVETKYYANLVDAVYREYLATLDGSKQRWGDKNIDYVLEIPRLLRLFPEAKIVHVIRDGRDVALSYREMDFGPTDLFSCAVFWRRRVVAGRNAGQIAGPDRYTELKYEDLVVHPEETCQRVCDFLGEPFSSEMLAFHEYNKEKELVPKHRLGWHQNTLKPITRSRSGLWRTKMKTREQMVFEAVAGEELRAFGYETHDFRIPAGLKLTILRDRAAWLGRGLSRRARAASS